MQDGWIGKKKPVRKWKYLFRSKSPNCKAIQNGTLCNISPQPENDVNAYKKIMQYLGAKGFKEKAEDNILSYYEYVYDKEGITYMDVFVYVNAVTGGKLAYRFFIV